MADSKFAQILDKYLANADYKYPAYSINDILVEFGTPLTKIDELDFVVASHSRPQSKLFRSLGGTGVFVPNRNQSGYIDIGVADWSIACGKLFGLTSIGLPFPVVITDLKSGGSSTVIASACRITEPVEWKKEKLPGVKVYRFETPHLVTLHGFRIPYVAS